MFLAIINDTYTDVKTELTVAPDEMQMQQYMKRAYYNILKFCKCKVPDIPEKEIKNELSVTIEEIRGALKKLSLLLYLFYYINRLCISGAGLLMLKLKCFLVNIT